MPDNAVPVEKVLLVEPDEKLGKQLVRYLKSLGYAPQLAGSVGGALVAIRASRPALVMMDAQLDEDSATVAFATRRAGAALVLMGRPDPVDALVAEIGAEVDPEHVLHKPFTAKVLAGTLRAAIDERRLRIEAEARRKQAETVALDAQLGELQDALADLGSLVGEVIEHSTPPKEVVRRDSGAILEPDAEVSPLEPEDISGHDLLSPDPDAPPKQSLVEPAEPPRAPRRTSKAPDAPRMPSRAPRKVSASPAATPAPASSLHDAILASPPRPAPARSHDSVLLDESALPPPPAESTELLARHALQPLTPNTPLDPRGIYGPVTMPELIYNCFRDLFSGWLVLRMPPVSKTILLRSGRPIHATSNVKSETLGAMLVREGSLRPSDLKRVELHAQAQGIKHGEALQALGIFDEEMVKRALRAQLTARIEDCFSWTSAAYGLRYDPEASETIEPFEINPLILIFQGIKNRYPLAPLLAHFDKVIKRVPHITPRLADYATMLRGNDSDLSVADVIDGERTLGEVLALSPLGLIDTLRVLRALESMNCIEYQERSFRRARTTDHSTAPRRLRRASTAGRQARPTGRSSEPGHVHRGATSAPPRTGRNSTGPRPIRSSTGPRPIRSSTAPRPVRNSTQPRGMSPSTPPRGARPVSAAPQNAGSLRREGRNSGTLRRVRRATSHSPTSHSPTSHSPEARGGRRRSSAPQPSIPPRDAPDESVEGYLEALSKSETYYDLLGVMPSATPAAINSAAASLLRKIARGGSMEIPDEHRPRAESIVRRVSEAGEALGNVHRRRTYDALHLPIGSADGPDLVRSETNFKSGQICLVNDRMDRARKFFELAAIQDPHSPIYQVYLAWATFQLTETDDRRSRTKALELAKEAMKGASRRDDGYVLLGRMYLDHGSHDAAVRAFEKALEINRNNAEAQKALSDLDGGSDPKKKETGLFGKLFVRR